MGTIIFYSVTMILEFDLFFENFNLANNFWIVSARALIFHMNILYDKTFSVYHYVWPHELGVWPILKKNLTLFITFEQWELEVWYFKLIFLVTRPLRGTIIFNPVTLTMEFDLFFKNINLANNFWTVSARSLIFHMTCVPLFFTLWPSP